jgi:hypothetical protein
VNVQKRKIVISKLFEKAVPRSVDKTHINENYLNSVAKKSDTTPSLNGSYCLT